MSPTPRTAVLLFSRSASAEAAARGVAPAVAAALLRRTERTLGRSGLPVLRSSETDQRGDTFGQRLTNALADAYAAGWDRLLVVGGDGPDLTAGHLRAAARRLAAGRPVLGPDHRGGTWLIGLHRDDFDPAGLAGQSWETDNLFAELAELWPAAHRLPRLHDVHSTTELRRLWWRLRTVFGGLHALLFGRNLNVFVRPVDTSMGWLLLSVDRGPPNLAAA